MAKPGIGAFPTLEPPVRGSVTLHSKQPASLLGLPWAKFKAAQAQEGGAAEVKSI